MKKEKFYKIQQILEIQTKKRWFILAIFKILPIVFIFLLIFLGNKVKQVINFYVGLNYLLFAILQSISITEKYGFGLLVSNFILIMFVSLCWFLDLVVKKNNFTSVKLNLTKFVILPFAFLSFWFPVNPNSFQPDFKIIYLFNNLAGLAFCLMTPVYLSILILYHPEINLVTFRVTSLVGVIIGGWNILQIFINPDFWWIVVLHLPLFVISIYSLKLSLQ